VETGALDRRRDRAIPRAARNVIGGKLGGHFPSVVWQTGSGSQIDINLNAAIANPANVALTGEPGSKKARSPERSCVDISRSSNDSFPTAMHIAAVLHIVHDPALNDLHRARRAKEQPFAKIVKIVRTYSQNATPLTLGLEFSDDAPQLDNGTKRLELAVTELTPPKNQSSYSITSMVTYGMIYSIQRLAASVRWCAAHRMNGTLRELMERSLIKVTALAPKIRCDNAAKMTKSTEPN
jgi:fumarate hydratase class II